MRTYDLPKYPNAFIGRANHLFSISQLLQERNKRLITLHGPGGMGKTRLAVKIGERSAEMFDHGVCFVALDAVTDHKQVPLYIGHRLGLKVGFNTNWIDEIINFLTDKHLLLILDNLEQILESAKVIARILHACPRVKILTTSRETLGLSYEMEYPLDSLNRPNPKLFPGPEDLLKFDAIDLFVQKAQASLAGFQFNEDNAAAIVQICQELDGLPLPIELAAARIKLFSPEFILNQLRKGTDLLKTRSKDVVLRHQTIRNTVKWSYDLLDADEQQIFQQLSLFRGGYTITSLEAVSPDHNPLEIIESFINKSLVVKGQDPDYSPRFKMLKLIRDYGLELLEYNPERNNYFNRFANYFMAFLEEARSKLGGSEEDKWIARIEADYENLEVAMEWLISNRPEMAGKMGADFWRFHLNRGLLQEGLTMVKKGLTLPIQEKSIKAKLLQGAGSLSHNLGNYSDAKDYFKQCLELWKDLDNKLEIVKALNNTAWAEWRVGNYEQTVAYSENALEISLELDDRQGQSKALNNLSWIHLYRGQYQKAEQLQRQILQIQTETANKRGIAFAQVNLAGALISNGKWSEAEHLFPDSIRLFEQLKDQQLIAFSRLIESEWFWERNNLEAAKENVEKHCLPNFLKIGDIWGVAFSHVFLGRIHVKQKNAEQAKHHLFKAMELYRKTQDKYGQAGANLWLGKLASADSEFNAAVGYLDRSLLLAVELGLNDLLMEGHFELGLLGLKTGPSEPFWVHFVISHRYAEMLGSYPYKKFLSRVHPYLEALPQLPESEKMDMPSFYSGEFGQRLQAYLTHRPGKEEIQKAIKKLLMASGHTNPPAPAGMPGKSTSQRQEEIQDPFVRQVRQVIEKHLHEHHFTIQELCREVGMSHSQLHRRLSRQTGQSVTKFIRSIRLDKARELLSDPQLTVAAVAYDTGFKDPDYFYRVFKKTFKMTPNEFRNSIK